MKKKTLTVAIALVLVVALAVGATYAYLTAKTETVTNTFTVGKTIDDPETNFILKEHKVAYDANTATYKYVSMSTPKAMSLLTVPSMLKSLAMSTMKSHRA